MDLLKLSPLACTSLRFNTAHCNRDLVCPEDFRINATSFSGLKNARRPRVQPALEPRHRFSYFRKTNTCLSSKEKAARVVCSVETEVDKNELFKDAAKAGDLNRVRELLASGEVDVNLPSPARSGWTALQLGAFYGHSEVTSYLLWAGADTEGRNNSGNTALQFACLKGNVQIAKMLLEAGADVDAVSNDKGSVIDYAQEWGGEDIVDFLLLWAAQTRSS